MNEWMFNDTPAQISYWVSEKGKCMKFVIGWNEKMFNRIPEGIDPMTHRTRSIQNKLGYVVMGEWVGGFVGGEVGEGLWE